MTVLDLKNYKDNLYLALSRDLSEFEKNFIFISTGILAFTITFLKDIINIEHSSLLWLLLFSWFLIIFSIGIMMYSFLISARSSDLLFKEVDDFMIENTFFKNDQELGENKSEEIKQRINSIFYPSKKRLHRLRNFAVGAFIAGIAILSLFIYINLTNRVLKRPAEKNSVTIQINPTKLTSIKISVENDKHKQADTTNTASTKTGTKTTDTSTGTKARHTKATTKARAKT